jgi:cell division protein FtsW
MLQAGHEGAGSTDRATVLVVTLLLLTGLLTLYSASAPFSARHYGSSLHLVLRQAMAAAVGAIVAFVLSQLDYRLLRRIDDLLLGAAAFLVILTVLPIPGVADGRWLHLGAFDLQPSELLKVALLVYVACTIERKAGQMRQFVSGVLPFVIVLGVAGLVILQQPDLGMVLVLCALVGTLLFLGGVRLGHLALVLGGAVPFALLAVVLAPYRLNRLMAFLVPGEFSTSSGYQTLQSLVAIGSGGLLGRGLGASRAKLFYLPQAHSDFVFSILGEELGLLGSAAVLALFAVLAWRALVIARGASDPLGRLLALGVGFVLLLQALVNAGVTVGLLPVTGLTLPFFSHGGSSLVVTLSLVGLLLSVSRHSERRV